MKLKEINNKIWETYFQDINNNIDRCTLERLYFHHGIIMTSELPLKIKQRICKVIKSEQLKYENKDIN
jgi:hypothetical protein